MASSFTTPGGGNYGGGLDDWILNPIGCLLGLIFGGGSHYVAGAPSAQVLDILKGVKPQNYVDYRLLFAITGDYRYAPWNVPKSIVQAYREGTSVASSIDWSSILSKLVMLGGTVGATANILASRYGFIKKPP